MKKFIFPVMITAVLAACGGGDKKEDKKDEKPKEDTVKTASAEVYGDTISEEGAMTMTDFISGMNGKDSMEVKITSTINECCQKKGCWMMVDMGNGEEMRVRFKDYGFFVPKDAAGREVTMEGWAYKKILSVDEQKHYLKDAGAAQEEIDAVTAPKDEWSFMAHGVIIKDAE